MDRPDSAPTQRAPDALCRINRKRNTLVDTSKGGRCEFACGARVQALTFQLLGVKYLVVLGAGVFVALRGAGLRFSATAGLEWKLFYASEQAWYVGVNLVPCLIIGFLVSLAEERRWLKNFSSSG